LHHQRQSHSVKIANLSKKIVHIQRLTSQADDLRPHSAKTPNTPWNEPPEVYARLVPALQHVAALLFFPPA
jgi:hypothetical protein